MLVALKCDLREKHADEEDESEDQAQAQGKEAREFIDYKQGLEVARRIQALRYLGKTREEQISGVSGNIADCLPECSAKRNRGVNEAFTEAARVALSVKGPGGSKGERTCTIM